VFSAAYVPRLLRFVGTLMVSTTAVAFFCLAFATVMNLPVEALRPILNFRAMSGTSVETEIIAKSISVQKNTITSIVDFSTVAKSESTHLTNRLTFVAPS
jgi:hypothetical protein